MASFACEVLNFMIKAKDEFSDISYKWRDDVDGIRSTYLSQHQLGSVEDDQEPTSAPAWRYMSVLKQLLEGIISSCRVYMKTTNMTRWYSALNRVGVHGHAELVSLPGDVPPLGPRKVRKVCTEDHEKAKPVAAESLEEVKQTMDKMRQTMEERLRS